MGVLRVGGNPSAGDAFWPFGLLAGALVSAFSLHGTALMETWEALRLAPLMGTVCLFRRRT